MSVDMYTICCMRAEGIPSTIAAVGAVELCIQATAKGKKIKSSREIFLCL